MKSADTDFDGKLSYEEFKVSILECEKKNLAGNCGNAIGDMLAYKAVVKAKAESELAQSEAKASNVAIAKNDKENSAATAPEQSSDMATILDKIFLKDAADGGN